MLLPLSIFRSEESYTAITRRNHGLSLKRNRGLFCLQQRSRKVWGNLGHDPGNFAGAWEMGHAIHWPGLLSRNFIKCTFWTTYLGQENVPRAKNPN